MFSVGRFPKLRSRESLASHRSKDSHNFSIAFKNTKSPDNFIFFVYRGRFFAYRLSHRFEMNISCFVLFKFFASNRTICALINAPSPTTNAIAFLLLPLKLVVYMRASHVKRARFVWNIQYSWSIERQRVSEKSSRNTRTLMYPRLYGRDILYSLQSLPERAPKLPTTRKSCKTHGCTSRRDEFLSLIYLHSFC